MKDFAPVSLLAEFPLLLAVGAEQPVKSVNELVEFARANPKQANYASSATPFQLAAELFNQRTGVVLPAHPLSRQRRCRAGGRGRAAC